ncbi:MAG: T9SS type A sorting domain-containing protein, partial [Flavobacterium sp.]|nr:T9SS type A sorting domain-containing protein [Flavobacterium sp.]
FRIVGYPNPFSTSFGLDLQTSSSENLSLSVYDMTGRLLEIRDVRVDEISGLQLGDRYPSGVYNVVAAQGSEIRTIRVIKQ